MKRLGKLVFMSEAEFWSSLRRTREDDDKMYLAGNNAGKFHAAGGYAHALAELRRKLKQAQEQLSRYKPIGEIFQPSEALTSLLQDVCGVSDVDAAADFEIVGQKVRREGARK